MRIQQLLEALRARHVDGGQGPEAAELERLALLAGKAVYRRQLLEGRFAGVTSLELEARGLSEAQIHTEITSRMAERGWGDKKWLRQVRAAQRKAANALSDLEYERRAMEELVGATGTGIDP